MDGYCRVAALTPVKGNEKRIEKVARKLSIDCEAMYCESNHAAIEWAKKYLSQGYGTIISRGGMAKAISKELQINVVSIPVRYADVAECVDRAKAIGSHIGILINSEVGHLVSTINKEEDISIMELSVPPTGNCVDTLLEARDRYGIDVIVGGVRPCALATSLDIRNCVIESGEDSIRFALLNAVSRNRQLLTHIPASCSFSGIMDDFPVGIIISDMNGIIMFANARARHITGYSDLAPGLPVQSAFPELGLYKLQNRENLIQPIKLNGNPVFQWSHVSENGIITVIDRLDVLRRFYGNFPSKDSKQAMDFYHFSDFDTVDSRMREILRRAEVAASVDSTVLITGETGVGKEILAQSIHSAGTRAMKPFFAVNCAAVPDTILESELFGYEEGAFTGARRGGKKGYFELAEGGTLFLDEIGELSPKMQAKLLRVLQEKEIIRVGGETVIPVDVRVIAATLVDLAEKRKDGSFRPDLYYRLNVIRLSVPPLRERICDIRVLVQKLSASIADRLNLPRIHIEESFFPFFEDYGWPGNVRELENIIERLTIMNRKSPISIHDIESCFYELKAIENPAAEPGTLVIRPLQEIEDEYIEKVLIHNGGDRKLTCEQLGISTTTLWRRLQSKTNS